MHAFAGSITGILVVGLGWMAGQSPSETVVVRPLAFNPKDPTVSFTLGGQSKVTVCGDTESVEKLVGKAAAKELIDAVRFENEQVVLVSWTTSGPPEGTLRHEVSTSGKSRKLMFYVQGPVGAKIRGQRARIGVNFFAVPRDVTVNFDPKERG